MVGSNFQKSPPSLCEILATWLIFTKVQSSLQKRPPMQNFTISVQPITVDEYLRSGLFNKRSSFIAYFRPFFKVFIELCVTLA